MYPKKLHPIPGDRLPENHFDYGFVTGIPDPNRQLLTIKLEKAAKKILELIKARKNRKVIKFLIEKLQITQKKARRELRYLRQLIKSCNYEKALKHLVELFHPRETNLIEKRFSEIYNNQLDITIQPTVGALRSQNSINKGSESKIYTNIFFYENFELEEGKEGFTKEDFDIYQNFSMGEDDRLRLCYYICFKRSNKKRGRMYRMHKFSIVNTEILYTPFGKYTSQKLDVNEIDDVIAFLINVNPKASRGTVTTVKPTNT